MLDWINWITLAWQIAAIITPLMIGAGFYWLKTKFAPATISDDLQALSAQVGKMEVELSNLLRNSDSEPTRHELLRNLHANTARLSHLEAEIEATRRSSQEQFGNLVRETQNQTRLIQMLIEKGMS